jgi:hypothetical protein
MNQDYAEIILKSSLKLVPLECIARIIIDTLGIYTASELASEINELEKTIPENEPLS